MTRTFLVLVATGLVVTGTSHVSRTMAYDDPIPPATPVGGPGLYCAPDTSLPICPTRGISDYIEPYYCMNQNNSTPSNCFGPALVTTICTFDNTPFNCGWQGDSLTGQPSTNPAILCGSTVQTCKNYFNLPTIPGP